MLLYRRVLPLRQDRMALALFTATQLPLVVAITTVAVDGGHMRSSTAAALVGAGALSTLAGPLHGLRMRRERGGAARRRGRGGPAGARVSRPDAHHEVRAAGRLFRLRIWLSSAMWVPVLAANLVAVALGIGLPILDRAARRPDEPAAGRLVGAGDLRRARRRDDHVHRDRVLRGLRRRPDPDVVLLAQARRAAAPRPGGDRRPRAADGHRDLLALRARGARPPDQRAGRGLRARRDGPLRARCSRWSPSARSSPWSSARSRARRSAASCARWCGAATP